MKKTTAMLLVFLLAVIPLLYACMDKGDTQPPEGSKYANEAQAAVLSQMLRENMPITDGSTSTLPLDIAARAAILGVSEEEAEKGVTHTKTWESLNSLTAGKCDIIIRTPLSKDERKTLQDSKFEIEEYPVSAEGFVFVVNRNNPVDTLTVQQLKDIYSGKITNWSEVGGADLPIIPYQRNRDSGSQNYMLEFMGDTPLMEPVTDMIPASMAGILDVIAGYDNGEAAIGYSVYAYSDGMYEDMAKIKYIKVNGIEPSFDSIADSSYPIIGYNYAIIAASQPENSPARNFAAWLQSDAGQKALAKAGYAPFRQVDGLILTAPEQAELYKATGSGAPLSDADHYYIARIYGNGDLPELKDSAIDKIIRDYIDQQKQRINAISDEEINEFTSKKDKNEMYTRKVIEIRALNGYLSVLSGIAYSYAYQDSSEYYYKPESAVFDLYSGKQLGLSDLFPKDSDFLPELNEYLSKKAIEPYNGFGTTHEMLKDFSGLRSGEFIFTADSIIFIYGNTFVDGVRLSLYEHMPKMSVSQLRDMKGIFKDETLEIENIVHKYSRRQLGTAVQYQNGNDSPEITMWLIDDECELVSPEVRKKINSFALDFYEQYLSPEKLLEAAEKNGISRENIENYGIGLFPDYIITLYGKRYIEFEGPNTISITEKDGTMHELYLGDAEDYDVTFYFDFETGEQIKKPQ